MPLLVQPPFLLPAMNHSRLRDVSSLFSLVLLLEILLMAVTGCLA
jgi:hypothetical protein